MILNMKICNNLTIDSLNDLVKLKILEEVGTTKINKSKVARDLGIDRRTVSKYMNGYVKKVNRERKSSIDEYYDVIKDLLDDRSSQVFFYKRVLWQYLKDNHGLKCAQSSFRR